MPELPEVETVRRGLLEALPGKKVTAVQVLRDDSIGWPDPRNFAKRLTGHTFADIRRRGKYIICDLDRGAHLVAHLRMSGRLLVAASKSAKEQHIRVLITLDTDQQLIFEDMRVFGRLWFVAANEKLNDKVSGLADLGIEPLEALNGAYMQVNFRHRKQPIKSALLDQTVIAGIGNIYADESLHLARINPMKPAGDLTAGECERLSDEIKNVLARAIEMRGSTLRNYTDSEGVNGNYQNRAYVYGRENEKCHHCGSLIERIKLAGRSSHFCPQCQPRFRKRRKRQAQSG